jgi:manganese/zinc/iron transport system substrate-binding protein
MKNYFLWVLMVLTFYGCSGSSRQNEFREWIKDDGKVKVLTTTAMINDLVKKIGGDHISSLTLIQGELDPHSYQLVKGDDEKLQFAKIIFYSGLGLEHGPSLQYHLIGNERGVSLGDYLEEVEPEAIIYVNGQKDPHIWMDISLWAKTVPLIVDALSQKAPLYAEDFKKNGDALVLEMTKAHKEVKETMHKVPADKRFLVTSHDAFNYYTRAYLSEEGEVESGEWQKRFAAPEGLAPESQLSANDIRSIIAYLKKYNIAQIFPETNVSRDSIRKIIQAGREQGLEVKIACCALYGDAMGKPGSEGDTYLKMIYYNAKTLSDHME